MSRIPSHTIADAPEASRPLLADMVQFSPTGRLLNLHAQMAHAPATDLDIPSALPGSSRQ